MLNKNTLIHFHWLTRSLIILSFLFSVPQISYSDFDDVSHFESSSLEREAQSLNVPSHHKNTDLKRSAHDGLGFLASSLPHLIVSSSESGSSFSQVPEWVSRSPMEKEARGPPQV